MYFSQDLKRIIVESITPDEIKSEVKSILENDSYQSLTDEEIIQKRKEREKLLQRQLEVQAAKDKINTEMERRSKKLDEDADAPEIVNDDTEPSANALPEKTEFPKKF